MKLYSCGSIEETMKSSENFSKRLLMNYFICTQITACNSSKSFFDDASNENLLCHNLNR